MALNLFSLMYRLKFGLAFLPFTPGASLANIFARPQTCSVPPAAIIKMSVRMSSLRITSGARFSNVASAAARAAATSGLLGSAGYPFAGPPSPSGTLSAVPTLRARHALGLSIVSRCCGRVPWVSEMFGDV